MAGGPHRQGAGGDRLPHRNCPHLYGSRRSGAGGAASGYLGEGGDPGCGRNKEQADPAGDPAVYRSCYRCRTGGGYEPLPRDQGTAGIGERGNLPGRGAGTEGRVRGCSGIRRRGLAPGGGTHRTGGRTGLPPADERGKPHAALCHWRRNPHCAGLLAG